MIIMVECYQLNYNKGKNIMGPNEWDPYYYLVFVVSPTITVRFSSGPMAKLNQKDKQILLAKEIFANKS